MRRLGCIVLNFQTETIIRSISNGLDTFIRELLNGFECFDDLLLKFIDRCRTGKALVACMGSGSAVREVIFVHLQNGVVRFGYNEERGHFQVACVNRFRNALNLQQG